MLKKSLIGLMCLAAITSCSHMNKNGSRGVADDRSDDRRNGRYDGRDEGRGDRHHGRDGFELGEYTSQEIRNNTGFIDVSEVFSRFRGLEGKNFKGLLIEVQAFDPRPGGASIPFPRDPRDPRDMREPRDPRDSRDNRDPRNSRPEIRDIYLSLDQRPVDKFQVLESFGRQFFYADLNREMGDKFGLLNIQYNPRNTNIKQITVLTNSDRPWDRPIPPPPVMIDMGVIYKNSATGKVFFARGQNQIDADFKAKELCQAAGYANNCLVYKTESLVSGDTEYFCSVKNTATGFSYKGLGQGRLEAEYNALASCHEKGYLMNCTADLSCSDGRMTSPRMLVGCMYKNSANAKTFYAKSNSEIQSKFLANQICQTAGYARNCGLVRCESGEESWNNLVCTISNAATNKTFRGDAKFKLEAEALARQSCESAGYANSCTKDLRCSN